MIDRRLPQDAFERYAWGDNDASFTLQLANEFEDRISSSDLTLVEFMAPVGRRRMYHLPVSLRAVLCVVV